LWVPVWTLIRHTFAAFTIATTPARIAEGNVGHAATIAASSGSSGVETLALTLGVFPPVS
jgi:hypothetical protein